MAETANSLDGSSGPNDIPIVGIGASAGGIQALQALFEALPAELGASFVVIVHLDPETRSSLAPILAARTRMPVVQVETVVQLRANQVYVIPPDRQLRLTDHELSAEAFDEPRGRRAPIDLFFRSLADRLGDGFAVVLTGAGSDGALGVRAVKEAGGIILVQDPDEAEYPSMPRSAIATGVADFVLPVRELAARLVDLVRNKESVSTADARKLDEELLRRIFAHVRARTGQDFSRYKRSTVVRRITRRMQVTRAEDLQEYYQYLQDNTEESQELFSDLLISVTSFFRDREAFDALRMQVVPQLFQTKEPNDTIRVWVPGCATGEEAFSVAMLLMDEAAHHEFRPAIQVFGTDLDARALSMAREGRFPAAIEADVSEERLRRYFKREEDGYRVRQGLRDVVLFAIHNLLKDPPFSHIDLISCRNLLIYLDRDLQEQACTTFHYALNPGGFIFLGASESVDRPPALFRSIDRNARIYQSVTRPGEKPRLLPQLLSGIRHQELSLPVGRPLAPSAALIEATMHRRAIEKVAPPSVVVDESHRVLHLSDNAGRYIQPAGGPLTGDLVNLARPELRFELRTALHRAFEQRRSSLSLPILVRFNGAPHPVHLQVKPMEEDGSDPLKAVVLFIEGEAVEMGAVIADQPATDSAVRRLQEELELTQARLQTLREESDSANEDLRAANEELQSINEEYRSTAEELETSKEELQSVNEELQTVNNELKLKLETVSRAHGDLRNLVAATDFGTLFLDADLRIKLFTERVTDIFSITASDEGRPITDFTHGLLYEDLVKDAQSVLTCLTPVRHDLQARNGRWLDVRMRPYRTIDNKIDGVVMTFVDITDRRRVDQALLDSEGQLEQQKRLVELSREPIFVWEFDRGIVGWNRGSQDLYGYSREEALGKRSSTLLSTQVPGSSFAELSAKLLKEGSWRGELSQRAKDGRELTVEARLELASFDGHRLVLESSHDVTDRKLSEQRQHMLLRELTHRVRNTLTVVQAIAHQTLRGAPSTEDFVRSFDGRLAALASAHNLLIQSNWQGADLAALARDQLEPYVSANPDRLRIEGEPIALASDLATPFGLVLHELATNAAKHGALSSPHGTIALNWTLKGRNKQRILTVVWREKGGPTVREPGASGFGSALIENGIPNAEVHRAFSADGFVCTIELPLTEAPENGRG